MRITNVGIIAATLLLSSAAWADSIQIDNNNGEPDSSNELVLDVLSSSLSVDLKHSNGGVFYVREFSSCGDGGSYDDGSSDGDGSSEGDSSSDGGSYSGSSKACVSVPEPGALALLGIGLAGLGFRRLLANK